MSNDDFDPVAEALRASLARHADEAPSGELLAERIVAATHRTPHPAASRRWRAWSLPLVAAGLVAALVAALAGIENYHPQADRAPAGTSGSATVGSPTLAPSPSPTPARSTVSTTPVDAPDLHGIRVLDLTFTGVEDGWALASAACVDGPGRCTALLRTSDGRRWKGMPGAAFNVEGVNGCADPCVTGLRFANDEIGYAFGPQAFFMTTDGGATWKRQPGGADALETLDGNVLRLVSDHGGCPGACNVRAETAAIGSRTWTPHALDRREVDNAGTLVRSGHYSVVMSMSGPAGSLYDVSLYVSSDGGKHWARRTDPCRSTGIPDAGFPLAGTSIAAAADGSISLLCQPGGQGGKAVTVTSTDGGGTFTAGRVHEFGCCAAGRLVAASSRVLVVVSDRSARSTDGGRTWRQGDQQFPDSNWTFAGFESTRVGRILGDAGRTIWTTWDAGATWSPTVLP